MKLDSIRIDTARLEQMTWMSDIPEMPGVRFKVRGAGNAAYRKLQSKLVGQLPRKVRRNISDHADETLRIDAQCVVETILFDWSGIEGEDGQPLPYSREIAEPMLANPDYAILLNGVFDAASRVADAEEEAVDDISGNSPTA